MISKHGFFLIVVFTLKLSEISAQNWAPINSYEKYNYSLNDSIIYTTIWADSSSTVVIDSVYFLNRVISRCVNCNNVPNLYYQGYLKNQPSFFLSDIQFKQEGFVFYQNDTTKFLLKKNAALFSSWMFDSSNNIVANVIELGDTTIFGNTDSISIILLSNNDTIIMSKNHGVLKFPIANNQHVKLIGIEGRNFGIQTPMFYDLFNFNIDDVFEYEIASGAHFPGPKTFQRYVVTGKNINSDTLVYFISVKERTYFYQYYYLIDSSYSSYIDTLIYINNDTSFFNKHVNELLNYSGCSYYKPIFIDYDNTFACQTKYFDNYNYKLFSGDTIYNSAAPSFYTNCPDPYTYVYGKGRGLLLQSASNNIGPYPSYSYKKLKGCKINGNILGTFSADTLLSFDSGKKMEFKASIFPNPTSDFITCNVEGLNQSQYYKFELLDLSGRKIKDILINKFNCINVSDLSSGFYFIRISSNKCQQLYKLEILK